MIEKAEKGKMYDFRVADILQLPGGITSIAGHASVAYDRFVPADAVIEVDGKCVGAIRLTIEPTTGRHSDKIAVATVDHIELAQYAEKNLILHCTFL